MTTFPPPPRTDPQPAYYHEFILFHVSNPEVYATLRDHAIQAKNAGAKIGIRAIWERMRWTMEVEHRNTDYKFNDHFTAHYARLLMKREPALVGFFEIRTRSERR